MSGLGTLHLSVRSFVHSFKVCLSAALASQAPWEVLEAQQGMKQTKAPCGADVVVGDRGEKEAKNVVQLSDGNCCGEKQSGRGDGDCWREGDN